MPVVPMVIISAILMFLFSKLTAKPARDTLEKYFPASKQRAADTRETIAA
jgi:hypothetical protein